MMLNQDNLFKLNTHEDHFYIHKILGITCLLHFLYRFTLLFTGNHPEMDFKTPLDLSCILLHQILSSSSLIFRISAFRNQALPTIYPELRMHNIIFAGRSVVCSILFYYNFSFHWNIFACFLTMLLADITTHYLKSETTIRGFQYSSHMTTDDKSKLVYHYSRSQVAATLLMLGNIDTSFTPLFAIQMSAFLLTLSKKGIIKGHYFHVFYTISLWVVGICIITMNPGWLIIHTICCNAFAFIRFYNNINKYISWVIVFSIFIILKHIEFDMWINLIIPENYHRVFLSLIITIHIVKNIITHTSLWA